MPLRPGGARDRIRRAARQVETRLTADRDRLALALGRMESRRVRGPEVRNLADAEFRVFSQNGEDGIIQYLVNRVASSSRVFVEIGVEDYRESNTRFLLQNDLWSGLIIDGAPDHLTYLEASGLRWRHTIDGIQVLLTTDNINDVLKGAGITGEIGLLSVDVDGIDYWLLDAADVISPSIIVAEYNALFGPSATVTVPYAADFTRRTAHWSNLYFGASLGALHHLLSRRGYQLVGCGSVGINAFFVRSDVAGDLPALSVEEAYVPHQHRESRDQAGRLTYVTGPGAQLELIGALEVIDVSTGATSTVTEAVEV